MITDSNSIVSVLIATYNGERYLHQQLQSVLDQTYTPLEIIISDDGSTDNTLSIIDDFQKKNLNIFLVKNIEKGVTNNFINAYKNSTGNFLAFCDQDDYWLPQKIELLMKRIGDRSLAYHNSLFVNENGKSMSKTLGDKINFYTGDNPLVFLLQNCISGHACLFTKELMELAIPVPKARYHDRWLAFVAASNNGVVYLPEVLVHYRQHSSSKTDILVMKKGYKHIKEWQKYSEEVEWFECCSVLKNDHQDFIKEWSLLYQKKEIQWLNIKLFLLGIKSRKILYSMNKKGRISVFFEALKLLWGIPLKKLL
jgi:glycosyltransferase involved in cell wall biosynthesis